MHRIIAGYLKTFCEDNVICQSLPESKKFELFANYCVIRSFYPESFAPDSITSDEVDGGIDGICYIIDGEIATTVDDAACILGRPKRNIPVDIYFIQSKTSDTYNRGEILKFGDGVKDFISDEPTLPQGDFLREQRAIFDLLIDNISKIQHGRPNSYLRYVCTSNNEIAAEIDATRESIRRNITSLGYFSDVDFQYIGLNGIIALWDKTKNSISSTIQTKGLCSYPEMPGITQAYLAVVPLKSFVDDVLKDSSGKIRMHIFEENVRAFLGRENPVNQKIKSSIENADAQKRFAILNNGITIISPDVRIQSNRISIENYQIVNGCQTSSVLFDNYELLNDDAAVTVKVVEVVDPDIISDIVRATNSQSEVEDTQFLAFVDVIRRIERYFNETQDIAGKETKLYFERRSGQYEGQDIPKRRIFPTTETFRAVGAMFLRRPDLAYRYPTKMITTLYSELTDSYNKEVAYYAATLALYRFKLLSSNGRIASKYTTYKWHILMILGFIASDAQMPKISSKKIESFCQPIINICSQSDEECLQLFRRATDILEEVGLKESRDEMRARSYTQSIINYCATHVALAAAK